MTSDTSKPIGHQYALAFHEGGEDAARQLANHIGDKVSLDAFLRVQEEGPVPAFLHSALCAMSLPTKRPKDETQPIVREDGKYALAINPRPILRNIDGQAVMKSLGVPYGSYPRVALIFLLSQAVMQQSRDVYLGKNFTEWMRRLGYKTVSYGPRGTASLMREQVDRLLACEWQIRWNGEGTDESAFAVRDVKLSNEYAGSLGKDGSFSREIRMSEVFFNHLVQHAVPLNEVAIRELKGTPTALDLYTYLAYRLPRIVSDKGQTISWDQLAKHLGNDAASKRFRQTVRQTMQLVSAVYPNANVDLSGRHVVLYPSHAPLEKKLVGAHLRLVGQTSTKRPRRTTQYQHPSTKRSSGQLALNSDLPAEELLPFPKGSLSYGKREKAFREVGLKKGAPWCVDTIAETFRSGFSDVKTPRTDTEWLRIWEAYVVKYAKRRANRV